MLVALKAVDVWLPDVPFAPVHAPDAVHVVELVDDQLSVLVAPLATDVGVALSVSVGSGDAATVTVAV